MLTRSSDEAGIRWASELTAWHSLACGRCRARGKRCAHHAMQALPVFPARARSPAPHGGQQRNSVLNRVCL